MIRKYGKNATFFDTCGEKILNPLNAVVSEEKNGEYTLQMTVLKDDCNLKNEEIVVAPTPYGNSQPFRIFKKEETVASKLCKITARHIFYDLLDNFVENIRPTLKTGQEAINIMLSATNFQHPFHGISGITKKKVAYWELKNPVEILIGDEDNSFVNRWGGEIYRDNWTFSINTHSQENIPTIIYSKNLKECGLEINTENIITRIIPTGLQENGQTLLKLPEEERYIDSLKINRYINPKVARIHYSDIKIGEEMYLTENDALEALRNAALQEFEKGIDLPQIGGTISIVDLSKTDEYKNTVQLEQLKPFDKVKVILSNDESVETTMVRYTFDAINEKYESIEFGSLKKSAGRSLINSVKKGNLSLIR